MIRTARRYRAALLVSVTLASFTSLAHAQTQGSLAEAAYQEGQKLMEQGKTTAACERFMASQEADPQLATLLNLAACHEKDGRTASAWSEFTSAATQAQAQGKKDQEKYARDHVALLEKTLHKVTITATKVDGLEIKVDKTPFPLAALGTGIPMDPGERTVSATAPGMKPWTKKLTLAAGPASSDVVVPPLEPEPVAVAKPVAPVETTGPGPEKGPEPKGTNTTKLALGLGIGGVGLIAAGVGAYFQFGSAGDHKDKSDAAAAQGNDAVRQDEFDQAKSASTIGITSMVIGAAAVGVGTYFVITSFGSVPSKASVGATKPDFRILPVAGPKNGGLAVVGTF